MCVQALREAWDLAAVVVIHRLIPRALRVALIEAGARLLRHPFDPLQLSRMVVDLAAARGRLAELPPRPARFSVATIQSVANQPVALGCECPNHLAALLLELSEFERFSQSCTSRSPEDAALHQTLTHGTARARMIVEDLLNQVCAYEGISLPLDEQVLSK
jgi:hypothetical protein